MEHVIPPSLPKGTLASAREAMWQKKRSKSPKASGATYGSAAAATSAPGGAGRGSGVHSSSSSMDAKYGSSSVADMAASKPRGFAASSRAAKRGHSGAAAAQVRPASDIAPGSVLRFKGSDEFRYRLCLSVLTGRSVRIESIRDRSVSAIGLRDHEVTLLRLLDLITNGTKVDINETGTAVSFRPGVVLGGSIRDRFKCGNTRGVSYYLEALLMLAPFGKKPLSITLVGPTETPTDPSIESVQHVLLPLLASFGMDGEYAPAVQYARKGLLPAGGGVVRAIIPVVRRLRPVHIMAEGFVKRVRGTVVASRISAQVANRAVHGVRGVLNRMLPDVYLATDHHKHTSKECPKSPGYTVAIRAETTSGVVYGAQACPAAGGKSVSPEDAGKEAASLLCDVIRRGGCADPCWSPLALVLMAATPEDVSRLRLGPLSARDVTVMRLIKLFLGVSFRLRAEPKGTLRKRAGATPAALVAKRAAAAAAKKEAEARAARKKRRRGIYEGEDGTMTGSKGEGEGDEDGESGSGSSDDDEDEDEDDGEAGKSEGAAGSGKEDMWEVAPTDTVLVSCVGSGMQNFAREAT